MSEKAITPIKIGSFQVGLHGLQEALEELAGALAGKSDAEMGAALVARLRKENYIPQSAEEEYGQALARECRRYLGEAVEEPGGQPLEVKIAGMGCPVCTAWGQTVMALLVELGLPADFSHVTDPREIACLGVMTTPALLINGRVRAVGKLPDKETLKKWLTTPG